MGRTRCRSTLGLSEKQVNIIKLSFAVCIFLFSSIILAGGSKSSVESSEYFVGVGAGDGGGAHGHRDGVIGGESGGGVRREERS